MLNVSISVCMYDVRIESGPYRGAGSGTVMSVSQRNLNTIYIHEGNLRI